MINKVEIKKVLNHIEETGTMNEFIDLIQGIEKHDEYYVLRMDEKITYDYVLRRKNAAFKAIGKGVSIVGRTFKADDFKGRLTIHFPGHSYDKHRNINLVTLLAIINQIVNNDYNTLLSYDCLEGNHMICKAIASYNVEVPNIENEENVELCTGDQNKRHYHAWSKVEKMAGKNGGFIAFKLSALDKDDIDFIMSKKTELKAFNINAGYLVLENVKFGLMDITLKSDGLWTIDGRRLLFQTSNSPVISI